jgi:tRNA 2-thiocytidine biosynthesis protein TtcA
MEKAIVDFGMIQPGDGVLAAVSGGKDSLTMLQLLLGPLVQAPRDFRLVAVHIDAGIPGADAAPIEEYFQKLGVEYEIVSATDIFAAAHAPGARKRPCFICSRLRRRILFETAKRHGCNRVALAHHRDDAVETLLMNIFFHREISAMMPAQPLFDGSYHLIRPLYYIREKLIAKFARVQNLPVLKARCPTEDHTRRLFVKNMLAQLESEDPEVHNNIFRAMFKVYPDYLPRLEGKLEIPKTK